ncbi:hypothetical protein RB200_01740 [Streptomyces sp. PmtG]
MRTSAPLTRTASALSALLALFTWYAVYVLAAAPSAHAEGGAAAQVTPARAAPGEQVTVSVACPATSATPPPTMDASSQAFEAGTVRLQRVQQHQPGQDQALTGVAYQGTARIAAAADLEGGGPDAVGPVSEWSVDGVCHDDGQWEATFTVTRAASGPAHASHAPSVAHGVRGGQGGAFTDSPAALTAGGVLVAGACVAAALRLRRDRASAR